MIRLTKLVSFVEGINKLDSRCVNIHSGTRTTNTNFNGDTDQISMVENQHRRGNLLVKIRHRLYMDNK